mmetsp:Transcript_18142/g.28169  ORF Transcript_18142/g.28169 Transcript_18142/m.28169 type:complete len:207 (-) Transcript_18142:1367-1987(-)
MTSKSSRAGSKFWSRCWRPNRPRCLHWRSRLPPRMQHRSRPWMPWKPSCIGPLGIGMRPWRRGTVLDRRRRRPVRRLRPVPASVHRWYISSSKCLRQAPPNVPQRQCHRLLLQWDRSQNRSPFRLRHHRTFRKVLLRRMILCPCRQNRLDLPWPMPPLPLPPTPPQPWAWPTPARRRRPPRRSPYPPRMLRHWPNSRRTLHVWSRS